MPDPFAPRKVIIDTGVEFEEMLVLLDAFRSLPKILLITITSLNGHTASGLKDTVELCRHVTKQLSEPPNPPKVVLAVGCSQPLSDLQDFNHTQDAALEHVWQGIDLPAPGAEQINALFTPSYRPGHEEILQMLRDNEPNTVTILALAPLTTLATAAAVDPETFLRAQEVLIVGGAVSPAEIIAIAEKDNIYRDPLAAARMFALTSPTPSSTLPQTTEQYPHHLSQQLKARLLPQSNTQSRTIRKTLLRKYINEEPTSTLLRWLNVKLEQFELEGNDQERLYVPGSMAVSYAATSYDYEWSWDGQLDLRIQLSGSANGTYLLDRTNLNNESSYGDDRWKDSRHGNRLAIMINDASKLWDVIIMSWIFHTTPYQIQ